MSDSKSDDIKKQADDLYQGFDTLLLSTSSNDGFPEISYASYVEESNSFYIFISELASHTRNLLNKPIASVMFIEDEKEADHAFARKRLTYRCEVNLISRDTPLFGEILIKMEQRFGALIKTLSQLNDFKLFELQPVSGQYVAGFGKTYEISYSDKRFSHVTQADIRKSSQD